MLLIKQNRESYGFHVANVAKPKGLISGRIREK